MLEALGAPPTSPMKQHPDPIQLLSPLPENLCPSATLHRTLPMTQSHSPRTGPGPLSPHLLTGEPWKGLPRAREGGEMTWAVPKGQWLEGPGVGDCWHWFGVLFV